MPVPVFAELPQPFPRTRSQDVLRNWFQTPEVLRFVAADRNFCDCIDACGLSLDAPLELDGRVSRRASVSEMCITGYEICKVCCYFLHNVHTKWVFTTAQFLGKFKA